MYFLDFTYGGDSKIFLIDYYFTYWLFIPLEGICIYHITRITRGPSHFLGFPNVHMGIPQRIRKYLEIIGDHFIPIISIHFRVFINLNLFLLWWFGVLFCIGLFYYLVIGFGDMAHTALLLFLEKWGERKREKGNSESKFRCSDLWVMSPTRFRCANSLCFVVVFVLVAWRHSFVLQNFVVLTRKTWKKSKK